jgi:hemerythrin superfamily protein
MAENVEANAIDMLEGQHREVEDLFAKLEKADRGERKQKLFTLIADKLAVHASIEEEAFYPAVKAKRTEDILLESLEEHLGIKRVLSDLIDLDASDETFDAKAKVLQEQVEHHVEEEEDDLFPKVRKIFDEETLVAIAQQMAMLQEELLAKGNPRLAVPTQTDEAAPL